MNSRRLALVAAIVLAAPMANAQQYLAAPDAARILADGNAWSVTASNGRKSRITLNRDGTGRLEGPMTIEISWQIKADDLCIDLKRGGNRCLRFKATGASYEGFRGTALDLTFARAPR